MKALPVYNLELSLLLAQSLLIIKYGSVILFAVFYCFFSFTLINIVGHVRSYALLARFKFRLHLNKSPCSET